jgi:AcrR family transcriptional regulator
MKDPSVLNSHSMSAVAATLKPRKSPVQARSAATIDALHVAAIQVLMREGLSRYTTTRIAERAGMSVGSLYQYYPNRDALLAAVLERHLEGITVAVEQACSGHRGKPVSRMASGLVTAFLTAKLRDTRESKALYAVAEGRGGAKLVARMYKRMVTAVAAMLADTPDARFDDPTMTATIALGALVGPVRTLLEGHTPAEYEAQLERQLIVLLTAFFRAKEFKAA